MLLGLIDCSFLELLFKYEILHLLDQSNKNYSSSHVMVVIAGFSTIIHPSRGGWHCDRSISEQSLVWECKLFRQEASALQGCLPWSSWGWAWWNNNSSFWWHHILARWAQLDTQSIFLLIPINYFCSLDSKDEYSFSLFSAMENRKLLLFP